MPALPIVVVGALGAASGLGQSARLCHDALKAAGLPVYGIDLSDALMQSRDGVKFSFVPGNALAGAGTLMLHINAPLVPLALCHLGAGVVRDKRIVGYWAWELPEVAPDWQHGVTFVHEIWVPSRFVAAAINPIRQGRDVHVVLPPVAEPGVVLRRLTRPSDKPFTVLTMFDMASSLARKNPFAAIAAFREAFGSDKRARLIVKAGHVAAYQAGAAQLQKAVAGASNIRIIDGSLTRVALGQLIDDADVLISLHRSEGFGLPLAEAMLRGLAVIATDWSGSTDFVSAENGFPIRCGFIPATDPQATYHFPNQRWADADVAAAADALLKLRNDPRLTQRLGAAGAAFGARAWSVEAYARTVRELLRL